MVHIRFEGRSYDLPERDLNVTARLTDAEIKRHLARHFDVCEDRFRHYFVDRPSCDVVIVRPEAVYG